MAGKKILVCVDSDGCAMDVMDIKHIRCFGPCLVKTYELGNIEDEVLKRWNVINLYSEHRGVNRFRGLYMILEEIRDKYSGFEDLEILGEWVMSTGTFSEGALESEIERREKAGLNTEPLLKALEWSKLVNISIQTLPKEKLLPYSSAAEVIKRLSLSCDIAVVSSANPSALKEEWERHKLKGFVRYFMAQDSGTKEECIGKLLKEGYEKERSIMVGDAVGDWKAADSNGIYFYPIVPGRENASWDRLERSIELLASDSFGKEEQEELLKDFFGVLNYGRSTDAG